MKKLTLLLSAFLAGVLLFAPLVLAANCPLNLRDRDGDGWVGIGNSTTGLNAAPEHEYYTTPIRNLNQNLNLGDTCTIGEIPKKVGDCVDLEPSQENIANSKWATRDKNGTIVKSNTIYPGANDLPGDGVDQSCSGQDTSLVKTNVSAQDVLDKVKNFLTMIIVSISGIILIWGGIMYAMAAGDEQKTKKARKAMLGAVIGLAVGLLAYTIIGIVAQNFI